MRSIIATSLLMQTTLSLPASSSLPPKPPLNSLPLPAKLAGGLFLFQTSVTKRDKELSREILLKAQDILRRDPLISMELGTGLEAGGVFSSSGSVENGVHQLVMEFQLNGGNSWAQCKCHGLKYIGDNDNSSSNTLRGVEENALQMISLSVSNMDAALNGGWAEVTLSQTNGQSDEEDEEYKLPWVRGVQ